MNDLETERRILTDYDTIAVVGLSTNPSKAAHAIPAALQAVGYRVIPVHPTAERILGEPAYRSLADIPVPVQVVEVFRPADEAPAIVRDAVAIGAKAVWLQLHLRSAEAGRIAADAGLLYVQDRCMAVQRALLRITKAGSAP
ncbi:MAG TPA: CoA-binding protein [Mycobacteriales bacterium]|nr:CoA-binding protein [Mycobacteriales bacterium]